MIATNLGCFQILTAQLKLSEHFSTCKFWLLGIQMSLLWVFYFGLFPNTLTISWKYLIIKREKEDIISEEQDLWRLWNRSITRMVPNDYCIDCVLPIFTLELGWRENTWTLEWICHFGRKQLLVAQDIWRIFKRICI